MKTLVAPLLLLSIVQAFAQTDECAKVTRQGDDITMLVDSYRPALAIANTLSQQFDVIVNAEDPKDLHGPQRTKLDLQFEIGADDKPRDLSKLMSDSVTKLNAVTPFAYCLVVDGEFTTLVPAKARDADGRFAQAIPLLDRKVTIPPGVRTLAATAKVMAGSLSAQTGLDVSCCQAFVAGIPWGMQSVSFEAHDEPARSVLERLIRLDQESKTVSSREYWLLSCDHNYCFINIHSVGARACRWWAR